MTGGTTDKADNDTLPMQLELTDQVKQQEIVSSYIFDPEIDSLSIELNHKYSKKKITSPIESTWPKTIALLMKELQRKGIDPHYITMLCDVADNAAEKILKWRLDKLDERRQASEDKYNAESASKKLLDIARQQCQEVFIDQYEEPYAVVKIREHLETLNLNHTRFRNWICKSYYEQEDTVPNSENVTNAINILKANAQFNGNSKHLHLRVAYDVTKDETGKIQTDQGIIWYDLTNPNWEAVKTTQEEWSILPAPILFRRHNAQPHVYPSKGYPPAIFDRFVKLLNVQGEKRKLLVKCYIIALFIPEIDKPILMLHGDPGGAKSTFQEFIKTLVDPSSVLTFALPKDIFELVQQLDHNYVVYYDNISRMREWISDQFCRASTGGGSSKRRLYTDDDDKIYNFKRCVGFNGINLAATKSDLLDRGLIIKVERIDDKFKRKKQQIWHEFEEIRPQLLGYILDMVVKFLAMRQTTSIKFEKLPRMADFAECAEIISRCMGNPDNQFMNAYYENIDLQTEEILATSLVASALLKFIDRISEWNGNVTELLEKLDQVVGEKTSRNKYWPKTASVLSRRINGVKTNLREIGIQITEGQQDPVTRIKTMVIRTTKVNGEMPFEQFDRRSESQNNDANDRTSNGSNDKNGILPNSADPGSQNTSNNTPGDLADRNLNLNPRLPPYVFRLGNSDKFACKYCKVRDDKWGMMSHHHDEEAVNNQ